jgi:large subunit ribosomal protein L25
VVIKLEDGTEVNAILQDIQFHPLTDRILHVDFYRLFDDKEISLNIPVQLEGAAPGVLNSGGVLRLNKRKLRVKALPKNLPDVIVANISGLELGNKLYTSELQTETYSILHPDNTVVCQVRTSRASAKTTDLPEGDTAASEEGAETGAGEASEEN